MSSSTRAYRFEEGLRAWLETSAEDAPAETPGGSTEAPLPASGSTAIGPVDAEAPPPPDPVALTAELAAVGEALARVRQRAEAARERAAALLERHDALVAARAEAEAARDRAHEARREAEALAAAALDAESRQAAGAVAARAAAVEARAQHLVELRRAAVAAFVAEHEAEPLLAERDRRAEADREESDRAAAAARLAQATAAARKLAAASRFEEALAALGSPTKKLPDDAEISSLYESIARDLLARKATEVEDLLCLAWRDLRADPRAVAERLAALDPSGVPPALAGRIFGCWSRACARLCRREGLLEPLRYAPGLGRGAVLARERADAPHAVVSALGMPTGWRVGIAVDPRLIERARPLR